MDGQTRREKERDVTEIPKAMKQGQWMNHFHSEEELWLICVFYPVNLFKYSKFWYDNRVIYCVRTGVNCSLTLYFMAIFVLFIIWHRSAFQMIFSKQSFKCLILFETFVNNRAAWWQQEGPGFDAWLRKDLFVGSLHVLSVSLWDLSGCSGFLPQPKDMQVRLTGDSKFRCECEREWLFLYVSPVMNWRLVQSVPRPH